MLDPTGQTRAPRSSPREQGPSAIRPFPSSAVDLGYAAVVADELEVRLDLPAAPRFLRLARLATAGMAGDLGFGVHAVEGLRVCVDELCASVIEQASPDDYLTLTFRDLPDGFQIQGSCPCSSPDPPQLHRVARELLDMLCDEYTIDVKFGVRTFTVLKRGKGVRGDPG